MLVIDGQLYRVLGVRDAGGGGIVTAYDLLKLV